VINSTAVINSSVPFVSSACITKPMYGHHFYIRVVSIVHKDNVMYFSGTGVRVPSRSLFFFLSVSVTLLISFLSFCL
jgi:hypothetical protein